MNAPVLHATTVRLPYRPPFDFAAQLWICRLHQTAKLEWFTEQSLFRVFELHGRVGQIEISNEASRHELILRAELEDPSQIEDVIQKIRRMFDLDCDPLLIAKMLRVDPEMARLSQKHPGVRLFSGWDPFEVSISTILGQLVSVPRAQALVGKLVEAFGRESGFVRGGEVIRFFPRPAELAEADLSTIGTTRSRQRTLREFASAVADGRISMDVNQEPEAFMEGVLRLHGIGPWSAHYMALRALRHTDAFPATDLILNRAREYHADSVVESRRPYRGYVAALMWREYAETLTKKKKGKVK